MNKIFYADMSWPETKIAAEEKRLVLIPIGSTEQHGPHLPTKTDVFIANSICTAVGKKLPSDLVIMPPVSYGYNEHHLDFPATIHIDYQTLISFAIDIGKSLARHGFEKLVIVNGHGSNTALMEIAARRITLETKALCASLTYLSISSEAMKLLKAEDAHAGDMETSLMLYLDPTNVDMSKAVRDWNFQRSDFIRFGAEPENTTFSIAGDKVQFMDWWSRMSKTGTIGDPTKADAERGKLAFDLFVGKLADFVLEFKKREIRERVDYH